MTSRLSAGDVLEVQCSGRLGYISYVGKHDSLGDVVWIVPQTFDTTQRDFDKIFREPGYFAFYPATTALRQGLLRIAGYSIEALHPLPIRRRQAVNEDESGSVTLWVITDGSERTPKRDVELSPDDRALPIADIWNHAYLCDRLSEGWRP
jgi:hypothetical protein